MPIASHVPREKWATLVPACVVCGCVWADRGAPLVWGVSRSACLGVLWRCPTLPQPVGCSTIGAAGLSFQVRNGAGRFPGAVTTTSFVVQPPPWGLRCCVSRLAAGGGGCGLIVVCIVVAACPARPAPLWGGVLLFSVGPLVPVGSRAPRGASTSGLSTRSSGGGLSPHGGGVETSSWSRLPA